MEHLFLLRFSGELSIKAKGTRRRFVTRLVRNLHEGLKARGLEGEVERGWSRLLLRAESAEAGSLAARTFGVQSVSPVVERPWGSFDELLRLATEHFRPAVVGRRFAVRARRSGERDKLPFRSIEVERALGTALLPEAAGVDLETPEVTTSLEIFPGRVFLFDRRLDGAGGIPLGAEGRALALMSGGFDSAVAAWRLMRRGVGLHCFFANLGGDGHRDAVLRVLKALTDSWSYGFRPQLHMVDFRPLVERLKARCPGRLWQVLLKRQMLRAAALVAAESEALALVTGEAVGQVSSQTLPNLAVISEATDLPILRPLVGSHKEEITAEARRIGTFDASAKVPELCDLDTVKPATRARLSRVLDAEGALGTGLLRRLVDERAVFDLWSLDLERLAAPELEVEEIPEGTTVLDLRSRAAYDAWHYPGASHLDFAEALRAFEAMEREERYVIYCEVGLKSAHLAEVMHAAGFRAGHFAGGVKRLFRRARAEDPALAAVVSPALLNE